MLTIRARIKLQPSAEGGRRSVVASGYRAALRFGETYTEASVRLLDRDVVAPGDECECDLTLPNPEYVKEHLRVGAGFDMTEGTRPVGKGTIIAIPAP